MASVHAGFTVTSATSAPEPKPWVRVARAIAFGAVGVVVALMLAVAVLAAISIGLLVALAALLIRAAPRRRRSATGPALLEARPTPEGWVAEAMPRASR